MTHQIRHLVDISDVDLSPEVALRDASNSSVAMTTVRIEPAEPVIECVPLDSSFAEPCGTSESHMAAGDKVQPDSDSGGDAERQEDEDEGENSGESRFWYEKSATFLPPPTISEAEVGLEAIKVILKPPRKNGPGSEHHGLDELTHSCLVAMKRFLWKYICGAQTTGWVWASLDVARDHESGVHHA
jgi:hypothetical protein